MNLVPNRECGECTVCCKVLQIDDPEFQKQPGVLCANCKPGAGCQIYDTRPEPCRGFFCGWRVLPGLGDDLRPDKSGIIIRFMRDNIPPGLNPVGFYFLLYGRTDVIGPGFADYLCRLIVNRDPVFLAVRGPDGFSDGGALLNGFLAEAIARGDKNRIMSQLREVLDALAKNKFAPAVFKYGTPALSAAPSTGPSG